MAMSLSSVLGQVYQGENEVQSSSDWIPRLEGALSQTNLCQCFCHEVTNFLHDQDDHSHPDHHGIDMDAVRDTLSPLAQRQQLTERIAEILHDEYRDLGERLIESESAVGLRVIPILLECPAYERPAEDWSKTIILDMARTLIKLKKQGQQHFSLLARWWAGDPEVFQRVVKVFLDAFESLHGRNKYLTINSSDPLVEVLTILHEVNTSSGCIVLDEQFYLKRMECDDILDTHIDIYLQNAAMNPFLRRHCLVDTAFLLPVACKWKILCTEVTFKQMVKQDTHRRHNFFAFLNSMSINVFAPLSTIPRLVPESVRFEIKRNHLVKFAYENVNKKQDFSLPLEIHFKDDISLGVNAGGPMKEFFDLFFKRILDVDKHSLFKKIDDSPLSTLYWFNGEYTNEKRLRSVGKLFSLMLYNKVLVALPFPLLFYKKLLMDSVSCFEDLRLLEPNMAASMQTLLTMSDEELQDLDLNFTDTDSKGRTVELREGGTDVTVTADNVKQYLELRAEHRTASSQFKAFQDGFLEVFNPRHLSNLFTPEELRSLFLRGEYNWLAFQESFTYEHGYSESHQVVIMFWKVFHERFDEDTKIQFLKFFTGSDHVPLGGFRDIGPMIWPLGDARECRGVDPSEICPEVNTCRGFVVLHLPQYRRKEDLEDRLLKALELNTGFHKIPDWEPMGNR